MGPFMPKDCACEAMSVNLGLHLFLHGLLFLLCGMLFLLHGLLHWLSLLLNLLLGRLLHGLACRCSCRSLLAFLRLHRRLRKGERLESPRAYLSTMVTRLCIGYLLRPYDLPAGAPTPRS